MIIYSACSNERKYLEGVLVILKQMLQNYYKSLKKRLVREQLKSQTNDIVLNFSTRDNYLQIFIDRDKLLIVIYILIGIPCSLSFIIYSDHNADR